MRNNKKNKLFSLICQTYKPIKLDFQKVDQHTVGKWLIHTGSFICFLQVPNLKHLNNWVTGDAI